MGLQNPLLHEPYRLTNQCLPGSCLETMISCCVVRICLCGECFEPLSYHKPDFLLGCPISDLQRQLRCRLRTGTQHANQKAVQHSKDVILSPHFCLVHGFEGNLLASARDCALDCCAAAAEVCVNFLGPCLRARLTCPRQAFGS